ncbi:hypothetical protein IAQ61_007380 [Plenodomus lingam]|uniref:uncharacterized protein n=1 Tax=Leptosphaeria maculans TaxID=5022 RepID=UPI003327D860|nr:hypothetical protein IAQ61_007380 [Plenodomus lingam]
MSPLDQRRERVGASQQEGGEENTRKRQQRRHVQNSQQDPTMGPTLPASTSPSIHPSSTPGLPTRPRHGCLLGRGNGHPTSRPAAQPPKSQPGLANVPARWRHEQGIRPL